MKIQLYATSTYTTTFLQKPTIAKIHSIFTKTVNLSIFNQIFALQPKGSYLSPLSLQTYYNQEQFPQFIQQIKLIQDIPFELSFDLQKCIIYTSEVNQIPFSKLQCEQYLSLSQLILLNSNKNGIRNLLIEKKADDFIFEALDDILESAISYFDINDYEKVAEQLAKLIGLGIGLTPSGDDFICGMLAVLHKFGLKQTALFGCLYQAIQKNLHQTNEISRAFIQCALHNHFSQTVLNFFQQQSYQDYSPLLREFEDIGHSSGIDTLCGIYFMLNLLKKDAMDKIIC